MSRPPVPFVAALAAMALPCRPAQALDPGRAISQYVLTKWVADDLPSNAVHALLQSRDGYLWLGTSAGLVRFDGARFVVFNTRSTPSFGDGGVSSLAEGTDGALLLGTTSGTAVQYKDGGFTRLSVPAGGGRVASLLSVRDGSLWIAPHGRPVYRWSNGRATSLLNETNVIGALALAEDAGGSVWIGTRREGLVRFAGGFQRLPVTGDTIQALCAARDGALWVGTPHGLLRLRDGAVDRVFTRRDGLSHDNVTALLEDRDGNLWVGTGGGGLNRLRDGRVDRLTTREGLSDDDVRSLLEDGEGNLWVGAAEGLNRLGDGRFTTYGRFEGLRDAAVTSVAEGAGGSVWIGTGSGEVARLRGGALTRFPLPGGGGGGAVLALHEGRDGGVWIGLDDGRLFRLKQENVTEHTPANADRSERAVVIFEDEQGPVFFLTGIGLARITGGRAVPLEPSGRALGYLHGAYRDREGALWLPGSKGLARLAGGEYRVLTRKDGLPHDRVRWITEDADRAGLWAATIGGLARIEAGVIRSVTVDQGLPENYLRLVLDDGRGYLWVASMGHIFRLDKRELADLFAGRIARVSPLEFDSSDGLRTAETLLGNNPGFRGADGRLWFATARGVSVVDPARLSVDEPAPATVIERVIVDGRPSPAGTRHPPGRGELTVEYTALRFASAGRLRFRYRLEGYAEGWVEAGPRRVAYYNSLPPGDYRFSVMASNRDGLWNGPAAAVAIAIRPPFFRTPLAYAAGGALVLGLVAGAHRLRVRRVRARLDAIIAERTRIARELHDTLAQGQAGIGIQIDTALRAFAQEPEQARGHLRLARAMVRSSLAEVRHSIWVLRAQTAKGRNGLASTLSESLAQLTADSGIETRLDVTGRPRALTAEVERNLLRIAHEAVTNAVRHADARTIATSLQFDADAVRLRVKDDGRGFDPEPCLSRRTDHFGLLGITERARALGGELTLDSRPGEGTEVHCRLPYDVRGAPAPSSGERERE